MAHYPLLTLVVAFTMLLGCAPSSSTPGGVDSEVELDGSEGAKLPSRGGLTLTGVAANGVAANGVAANGVAANGVAANGIFINETLLDKVALSGAVLSETATANVTLREVALAAGVFSGRKPDGTRISGDQMLGVSFWGELANGTRKRLRIESRVDVGNDVSAYEVTYPTAEGREHLCGLDAQGAPVLAIPVNGGWSYAQGVPGAGGAVPASGHFTFACRGAAIAKCVELGYKPWEASPSGTGDRTEYLVACVRALRADYCGDGTAHTVNGTLINLYDDIGVQADGAAWGVEAEWTAAGARFVRPGPDAARHELVPGAPPACIAQLESAAAGNLEHFDTGTLLITEFSFP